MTSNERIESYMDNNTMSSENYTCDAVSSMFITCWLYSHNLFRPFSMLGYKKTASIYYFCVTLAFVFGFMINRKSNRNFIHILSFTVLPTAVFALISYYPYCSIIIPFSIILACILVLRDIRNFNWRNVLKEIKRKVFNLIVVSLSFCFCTLLFAEVYKMIVDYLTPAVTYDYPSNNYDDNDIDFIKDKLKYLSPDYFSTASINQKLTALQYVSDLEAKYCGLSYDIPVLVDNLDEDTRACYTDRTRTLTINLYHLENGEPLRLITSVCHEVYHSYSYRLCDLYDSVTDEQKQLLALQKAPVYKNEFGHDLGETLNYYFSSSEMDARNYASFRAEYYKEILGIETVEETENQD